MAARHCEFDVLSVVVLSANDDQILEAAGYKELVATKQTKISRPQVRSTSIFRVCPKGFCRFVVPPPVAAGYARPRDPDFADHILRAGAACVGIHDAEFLIADDTPA